MFSSLTLLLSRYRLYCTADSIGLRSRISRLSFSSLFGQESTPSSYHTWFSRPHQTPRAIRPRVLAILPSKNEGSSLPYSQSPIQLSPIPPSKLNLSLFHTTNRYPNPPPSLQDRVCKHANFGSQRVLFVQYFSPSRRVFWPQKGDERANYQRRRDFGWAVCCGISETLRHPVPIPANPALARSPKQQQRITSWSVGFDTRGHRGHSGGTLRVCRAPPVILTTWRKVAMAPMASPRETKETRETRSRLIAQDGPPGS